VAIDELIIGRAIQFPVQDKDGMLLLAAGCTITSEIKKSLKARNIQQIAVNKADVGSVTLGNVAIDDTATALQLGMELTGKLDEIIDGGLMTVKNTGEAVKDRVVFIGCKAYDSKQREKLVESHNENGKALGGMISQALHGKRMDGGGLAEMTSVYLKELTTDTDNVLTSAMNCLPDNEFVSRSLEVSLLAMAIGVEMGYDADNVRDLGVCGMVNDWGMMRVPSEVRNAPRRLTSAEMLEIKKHPIYSLEILQRVSSLPQVASLVAYQVHEQPNGRGYPRGRKGNSIHAFSRIILVADNYIGLTRRMPYRGPYMRYAAMECLVRMARDRAVDPEAVRALLRIQSLFPIGSFVTLGRKRGPCHAAQRGPIYAAHRPASAGLHGSAGDSCRWRGSARRGGTGVESRAGAPHAGHR
jgi:HD-GYP domain-containing protein (c-di-GMP phosphodiesterase class II)